MSGELVPANDLPEEPGISGNEVPASDLPDTTPGQEVPTHDLPEDALQSKYSTPGQQAITVGENFLKGVAPGISTYAEQKLGVPTEDIVGRQAANPGEAGAAEIGGNVALMAALPEMEFAKLGQIGSKAINAMIQMGGISGGDEISKALLGQGDPTPAVAAHIAENAGIGLVGGGIFGKAEQVGIKALENAKLGTKLNSFIAGLGHAATIPSSEVVSLADSAMLPQETKALSDNFFKLGQTVYKNMGGTMAFTLGKHLSGAGPMGELGGLSSFGIEKAIEKIIAPYTSKISQKYIAPAILKVSGSGTMDGLSQALDHATTMAKGARKISNGVENLFKAGSGKAVEEINNDRKNEELKDFMDSGGVDREAQSAAQELSDQPQGYAQGGEIAPLPGVLQPDPLANVWPEQNIMLNAAKGRVSKYLDTVRPLPPVKKLPYDEVHKDPQKEIQYNQALGLANHPLKVLNHIKDGSLLPKHVDAIKQMYPELHQELSKKITTRMMKGNMSGEKKPPYHVRQALSLFLGSPVDSTLSQPGIMAAQNVFSMQKSQNPPPPNSKSFLNKIAQNAQTPDQGREQRLNKS